MAAEIRSPSLSSTQLAFALSAGSTTEHTLVLILTTTGSIRLSLRPALSTPLPSAQRSSRPSLLAVFFTISPSTQSSGLPIRAL